MVFLAVHCSPCQTGQCNHCTSDPEREKKLCPSWMPVHSPQYQKLLRKIEVLRRQICLSGRVQVRWHTIRNQPPEYAAALNLLFS